MRMLRIVTVGVAMMLMLAPAALAQIPQKPTDVPPTQAPTPTPSTQPIALFPAEARFAFIDFQQIVSTSVSGKLALRILKEFSDKRLNEIEGQNKQLQALSSKRDAGVLSGAALAQIDRDMLKLQREIQFLQQDAQAEFAQMQTELDTDLRKKVVPVVADIAKEKGLHAVFAADSSLLYILPALNISDEVIKRVDAQPKK
jgi:Skp family chaperone for outer membrane proteins